MCCPTFQSSQATEEIILEAADCTSLQPRDSLRCLRYLAMQTENNVIKHVICMFHFHQYHHNHNYYHNHHHNNNYHHKHYHKHHHHNDHHNNNYHHKHYHKHHHHNDHHNDNYHDNIYHKLNNNNRYHFCRLNRYRIQPII